MNASQHSHLDNNQQPTPEVSPEQAREALARVGQSSPTGRSESRRYGWYLAGFGVVIGLFVAGSRAVTERADSSALTGLLAAVYFLALWGLIHQQQRKARTVPRHAKVIGYVGLGLSLVPLMVGLGWLNWMHRDGSLTSWPQLGLFALAISAPLLVAGLIIRARA